MAMEIVGREELSLKKMMSSNKFRSRNAKMSLEDYLQFVESLNYYDFSINYINQIIAMHGYKKIHKTPKVVLTSAMSSIALMSPCRSTLNENISPSESEATLESIVKDLSELNWQECSITSVEDISALNKKSVTIAAAASSSAPKPAPKKRRLKKSKEETNRRALKPKEEINRKALKPKENAIFCASDGVKRSKRVVKKKKKCGCSGCVSLGACSFAV